MNDDEYLALYRSACDADNEFRAALVQQFGERRACDERYSMTEEGWSPEVVAARVKFQELSTKWTDAMRERRTKGAR